jgi:hypothetical protein
VGAGGEMTQALYAHMNNKPIKKKLRNNKKKRTKGFLKFFFFFFLNLWDWSLNTGTLPLEPHL